MYMSTEEAERLDNFNLNIYHFRRFNALSAHRAYIFPDGVAWVSVGSANRWALVQHNAHRKCFVGMRVEGTLVQRPGAEVFDVYIDLGGRGV